MCQTINEILFYTFCYTPRCCFCCRCCSFFHNFLFLLFEKTVVIAGCLCAWALVHLPAPATKSNLFSQHNMHYHIVGLCYVTYAFIRLPARLSSHTLCFNFKNLSLVFTLIYLLHLFTHNNNNIKMCFYLMTLSNPL